VLYTILADATILVHFFWIVFIIFGFVFALKRSKIAWLHLAGLSFSLFMNMCKWYCPLTYLENFLYTHANADLAYGGSFIGQHIGKLVYPSLPENVIRGGEIIFVVCNLIAYAFFVRARLRKSGDLGNNKIG